MIKKPRRSSPAPVVYLRGVAMGTGCRMMHLVRAMLTFRRTEDTPRATMERSAKSSYGFHVPRDLHNHRWEGLLKVRFWQFN